MMRKIFFLLAFCTLSFLSFGQCNRMVDSLALVDLYNSTGGSNWTYPWTLTEPMSTWYGITLNSEGCVACIDLDGRLDCGGYAFNNLGNNLIGYIPEAIGNLSQIDHISFGNNFLTGAIPISLGQLQTLRELIFRYNDLTGSIPSNLSNLHELELLNLTSNALTGQIPSELSVLENLNALFLSDNDLDGDIPVSFVELMDRLNFFAAADNQLTGQIPAFLSEMYPALRIDFANNLLEGCFPEELRIQCGELVIFSGNIALPWQGDFGQFCNSSIQIGAPCEDGLDYTINYIDENCDCFAMLTSTNDISENSLSIYPNPIKDEIIIRNEQSGNFTFTLFSRAGGKLISFEEYQLDVSFLVPGMYILKAENRDNGASSIYKFVKF